MSVIRNPLIGFAILALLAGCQGGGKTDGGKTASGPAPKLGSGEGEKKVVAVIDDQAVTIEDFKERMNRQSPTFARGTTRRRRRWNSSTT